MNWSGLSHEYGVDGTRLLPWQGAHFPFGGAWCVVRPGTQSLDHVNAPKDENELFIVISGQASVVVGDETHSVAKGDMVFIQHGLSHHITNNSDEDFHFYSIWWNSETVDTYNNSLCAIEETN
jgi:oxalate decarboxylase/phosphoglucose isomerase-like protein (cupin superfamily)